MSDTNINGSAPEESPTNAVEQTEAVEAKPKHAMTRRQVLAMAGSSTAQPFPRRNALPTT